MILCNECGNPLGEGAKFCQECGAPVGVSGDAASQPRRRVATPTANAVKNERHRRDREYWQSINDSDSENKLWDVIKNSNDAEKFHEYLKTFPNGAFAAIAQLRLRNLKKDHALASLMQRNYD